MLYGRKCRTPTCWLEAGEKQYPGPDIVQITSENVTIAREKFKVSRDRQKIFGKRGKLAARFIGPFTIREVLNDQTVVLDLPSELVGIHNTFNMCYLRKCKVEDESQILPLKDLKVDLTKRLVEESIRVVDRKITKLRKKQILMMLVEWRNILGANMTWETE
ncbi:uncharacterized protein [Rutidosis leptorrhynchoides]|uniref:uncharacterized protein n=1 Tax=Rutidosis leptorrhynchoides TaxID=125765 RepID=UPI003A99AF31